MTVRTLPNTFFLNKSKNQNYVLLLTGFLTVPTILNSKKTFKFKKQFLKIFLIFELFSKDFFSSLKKEKLAKMSEID